MKAHSIIIILFFACVQLSYARDSRDIIKNRIRNNTRLDGKAEFLQVDPSAGTAKFIQSLFEKNNQTSRTSAESRPRPSEIIVDSSERHTFVYDKNGRVLRELLQIIEDGRWTDSIRRHWVFDTNGRGISCMVEKSVNGRWCGDRRYSGSYNKDGDYIMSLSEAYDGSSWRVESRMTCTEDNLVRVELSENMMPGMPVISNRYTFVFDSAGNKIRSKNEVKADGSWKVIQQEALTYNSMGNVLTETVENWPYESSFDKYKYTFTYDSTGRASTQFCEKWANNGWTISWRESYVTYTMDDKKYWVSLIEHTSSSSSAITERFTTVNDKNGRELQFASESLKNGKWNTEWREDNEYDNAGNIVSHIFQEWNDSICTRMEKRLSTYTGKGELLCSEFEAWQNGGLKEKSRCIYSYDSSGNTLKGQSFVWSGNQWKNIAGSEWLKLRDNGLYSQEYHAANVEVKYDLFQISNENGSREDAFCLEQNYPNPFNSTTAIKYNLPEDADVTLNVYNSLGQKIASLAEGHFPAGLHAALWNASDVASGVYFYRLTAGEMCQTKKLLLVK